MPSVTANILGNAIYCECYLQEFKRYKILGSVTDQGYIEILRGHKNKTVIQTQEFMISCKDCGFRRYIILESMAVNRPTYEQG